MKEGLQQIRDSLGGTLTPVVRIIVWINVLVFVFLWLVSGHTFTTLFESNGIDGRGVMVRLLGLVPFEVVQNHAYWQPFTYLFVHVTGWHLFLNMLGLWWTGPEVERYLGSKNFWRYYLFTGVGGALAALAISWGAKNPTIGASGSIFGLLVAYGFLFPDRTILLWFVIPVRAKYAVMGFAAITMYALWQGSTDGVSHIAHFGGMVFGVIWFLSLRSRNWLPQLWRSFQKRRMRRKLRLITKNKDEDKPTGYTNNTVH